MSPLEITKETVLATYNTADSFGEGDILHAAIGLTEEAAECLGAMKKWQFYGQEPDWDNIIEEAGDAMFYLTALLECIERQVGLTPTAIAIVNQEKLRTRYPDGFSTKASIQRADKR